MPDTLSIEPITLYGCDISYFTGKLENYFRVRGIPYELRAMQLPADAKKLKQEVGLFQMPALQLGDGRWMTDSTKIIQWFETQYPQHGVIPHDPVQAFVCLLIEDWADEWWWRPAMHYRWYYPEGAHLQSRHLADELMGDMRLPGYLKRNMIRRRQRGGYTTGDGMTAANVAGVEAMFLRLLAQLQAIFSARPFLLGERPSLADIGLSGPFFRHFALDPVPLEIIRKQAPAVLEWVARLWNTRLADCNADWVQGIPDDLGPLLDDIGSTYLPYLCANVDAVSAGQKRFDVEAGGVLYQGARYSRYRVWCLQALRAHYQALPEQYQAATRALLQKHGCWEPLWQRQQLPLLPGQEEGLPFRADCKMVAANE
ncbi:glutathione S-transferase family protein [Pseudohalioglobus lutimaris]|uniref:Glutathione S-transferase family protein n=1 Tax=Pseudohalioglobus lutimaris TaxID=1737061 RepID=A0A2N5X1S3_9GAMM|nr:glutathione S-transferase family protein [Pseudohalioglobus lutimaris]PLW68441.1 glutathione S-transferase family protein [Pseudohalioglobus lutimaris]